MISFLKYIFKLTINAGDHPGLSDEKRIRLVLSNKLCLGFITFGFINTFSVIQYKNSGLFIFSTLLICLTVLFGIVLNYYKSYTAAKLYIIFICMSGIILNSYFICEFTDENIGVIKLMLTSLIVLPVLLNTKDEIIWTILELLFILLSIFFIESIGRLLPKKDGLLPQEAFHFLVESTYIFICFWLIFISYYAQRMDLNIVMLKSNIELKKANEIKNELLIVASHDLKNPLQSIIGYAEMIEANPSKSDVSEKSAKIRHSAERMLNIMTNLLETSALDSGMVELNLKKINLNHLLISVINNNQAQAIVKNQKIQLVENDECYVNADEDKIFEVLDNLINNAIKYSPKEKNIEISILGINQKVHVKIRDEGPGLTDEDKQKLFGKFQRLSARPTAGETSTGLGLSIVKDVIELHHGKVWAESEIGNGSTFIVELPLLIEIKTEFGNEV